MTLLLALKEATVQSGEARDEVRGEASLTEHTREDTFEVQAIGAA